MLLSCLAVFLLCRLAMCQADLLAGVECEIDPVGYLVPDPEYCNR